MPTNPSIHSFPVGDGDPDPIDSRLRGALFSMRERSKVVPSRELSIAITNTEQAIMWLGVSNGVVR